MLSIYKEVILLLVAAMIMCLSGPPTTGIIIDQGLLFLCIESMLPRGCSRPMAESSWDTEAGLFLGDMGLLCQLPLVHRHRLSTSDSMAIQDTSTWTFFQFSSFGISFWMVFPASSNLFPIFFLRHFSQLKNLRTFNLILISYSWRTQPNTLVIKWNTQGKWKGTLSGSTK